MGVLRWRGQNESGQKVRQENYYRNKIIYFSEVSRYQTNYFLHNINSFQYHDH